MREEEDFVLQSLAVREEEKEDPVMRAFVVREEEDSPFHLHGLIVARELLFGHELNQHVGGRPLAALPAIRKLHLSPYGRRQEHVLIAWWFFVVSVDE